MPAAIGATQAIASAENSVRVNNGRFMSSAPLLR
jgi:hypothetical protein